MSPFPYPDLLAHLYAPAPGFRCYVNIDRSKTIAFTAAVTHQLGEPATEDVLKLLDELTGYAGEQLRSLIALHDGLKLYCDPNSESAGFEVFPVAEWAQRGHEMRGWYGEDDVNVVLPDWFNQGIVFGQVPESANYFVLGIRGNDAGKIFYFDHDDFHVSALFNDFQTLVDELIRDPVQFLIERGCYTIYFDGKTKQQWLPSVYVSDVRPLLA